MVVLAQDAHGERGPVPARRADHAEAGEAEVDHHQRDVGDDEEPDHFGAQARGAPQQRVQGEVNPGRLLCGGSRLDRFFFGQEFRRWLGGRRLRSLLDTGAVERIARGLYRQTTASEDLADLDLVEIARRAPRATPVWRR